MAEIAAIGLIASIITLVDASKSIADRVLEFQSSTTETPKAFRSVALQLPILKDAILRIKNRYHEDVLNGSSNEALLDLVDDCQIQIRQLDGLINELQPVSTDSKWRRARKAITSFRKERNLLQMHRTLMEHTKALAFNFNELSSVLPTREDPHFLVPTLRVSQFVERGRLLKELDESFTTTPTSVTPLKVVILHGMGGQGKTQLALEYCRAAKLSKRFQSFFWIDASSSNTVSRGFENVAAQISNPGQTFDNIDSKISFVKETLGARASPWLMVFDNYDNPGDFKNIKAFFPFGFAGSVLITSRHAGLDRLGIQISVTRMTESESLELLLSRSNLLSNDENDAEGSRIVEKLGYLPLAIDQAGAYISTRMLSLPLFEEHFEQRKEYILREIPAFWDYQKKLGNDQNETSLSVLTTWEMSFQQINGSDEERELIGNFLMLSAFLDYTRVDEGLFKAILSWNHSLPKWLNIFTSGGSWDKHKYADTIVRLKALSLVQSLIVHSTGSRFSLHPLIADWLQLRLDRKHRQEYAMEAIKVIAHNIKAQNLETLQFQARLDLLAHLDTCLQLNEGCVDPLEEMMETALREPFFYFGHFYEDHGRYHDAETMYHRALAGYEKALGPNHLSTLDTVNNLGLLYTDQGKLDEAEAMYQRALTGYEQKLGVGHELTLDIVSNLGVLYVAQRKPTQAESMYIRALAGFENSIGHDHPRTLFTVNNLGNLYLNQCKLEAAEAHYRRALKGKEKALGSSHTSTLNTVDNLGLLYEKQGKAVEAEAMFRQALAGKREILGPDHPSTLNTVVNLEAFYTKQGRGEEAEALRQPAPST